jgi:hypothetical protein
MTTINPKAPLWHASCEQIRHPVFNFSMQKSTHILLVAMLAVLFSTGVNAQPGKGDEKKGGGSPAAAKATTKGKSTAGTSAAGPSAAANPKAAAKVDEGEISSGGTGSPGRKNPNGTAASNATTKGKSTGASSQSATSASPQNDKSVGNVNGNSPAKAKAPNENASDNAKAVHAVIEKFQAKRNDYLAERKELLEKLKIASEGEKKAIVEQLREDKQAREDEERALAKEIREELKELRAGRRDGGN